MPSLEPQAPLSSEHLSALLDKTKAQRYNRAKQFTFDMLFSTLRQDGAQELAQVVSALSPFQPEWNKGHVNTNGPAGTFAGIWGFFASEEGWNSLSRNTGLLPQLANSTQAMLMRMNKKDRGAFCALTQPVWQWMARNEEGLRAMPGGADDDISALLLELPPGILAKKTMPTKSAAKRAGQGT